MAGSPSNFVPTREAELVTFSNNFNAKIVAAPATYGLVAAQATAYTALHNAWVSAYQTANNPDTRSPSNIIAKNTAKEALVDGPGGIRALARIVQASPSVTDESKSELGLTVRDVEPSPVPVPKSAPDLSIISTLGRSVKIRLRDVDNPDRRGKPDGVMGATILTFVGEDAPAQQLDWSFTFNTSKTVVDVEFPAEIAAGAKVWLTAFWYNTKAQAGTAAAPVSVRISDGMAMAA